MKFTREATRAALESRLSRTLVAITATFRATPFRSTRKLALTDRLRLTRITFRRRMLRTAGFAATSLPLAARVRFPARVGDIQFLTHDPHLLQAAENLFRHSLRQIHKAVILMDINMPDVPALEARFVGNGTHNVARLHAMDMPHVDPECFERDALRSAFLTRRGIELIVPLATSRPLKLTRLTVT
jgi:hypothetical protein